MASTDMTAADRIRLTNEARATGLRAGLFNAEYVTKAYHLLMKAVPQENGAEAAAALRRVTRTMGAFAALAFDDRQIIAGGSMAFTPAELAPRVARIMASNPDLASLADDMAREADKAATDHAKMAAAQAADSQARQQRRAEAPGIVAKLAARGVRLDVVDGRVRAWPRSLLEPDDLAALASHAAELPAAVQAEWTA